MKKRLLRGIIKSIYVLVLVCASMNATANPMDRIEIVFGPRVGFSYTMMNPEEFTNQVNDFIGTEGTEYIPFMTQFGLSVEQRIVLGTTKSHFVFQELVTVGGFDQSIAIPTIATLLGFRSDIGFEVGMGPIWSPDGFAVVFAGGWTFSYKDVYVPVDIVFVPDFQEYHHRIGLYTGFNFNI